jgi:curved DNA-binding protein CbpA
MAVTDKRKKQRNQAPIYNQSKNSEPAQEQHSVKKNKRVAKQSNDKQHPRNNKSSKSKKKQSSKQVEKNTKKEKMGLEQLKKILKESYAKFKQMIFWTLIVAIMFLMRFYEEGFGAFQQFRATEDLYKTLNSEPHFTAKQIKSEYRKLVNEFHPDKNPNCEICEDKITKINKAYEVLKDPETKKIYDQTKGVINPIRSSTLSLTSDNIRKEVLENDQPVIIQIYAENNGASQRFAGFWEDLVVEHSYIKFARINLTTESKLAQSFDFGVEELPFVFSHVPGRDYEFFDFNEYYEGSTMSLMNKYLKKVIKRNTESITFKQFRILERNENLQIIFIRREYSPLVFENMALKYKSKYQVQFYSTNLNEHKHFFNHFKKDNIDYVMLMPSSYENGVRVVYVDESKLEIGSNASIEHKMKGDEGYDESDDYQSEQDSVKTEQFATPKKILKHYVMANYMKSQMNPSIYRLSFKDFCKTDFTSFDGQMPSPTICILTLKHGDEEHYQKIQEELQPLKDQLESEIYATLENSAENTNSHIHRYQFGYIDLKRNWNFRNVILNNSPLKNPKVMVYLSESDRFMILNNIQELEDVIEDSKEGIFQDYKNFNTMFPEDSEFEDLFMNENISLINVITFEVNQILTKGIILFFLLIALNGYLYNMENNKIAAAYATIIVLFLSLTVIQKMRSELIW